MKKKNEWFVPSLPEYEPDQINFDRKAASAAYARYRKRMKPTSIALPPEAITELKLVAMKYRVPYQTLMRSFVLRGLSESRVADAEDSGLFRKSPRKKKSR